MGGADTGASPSPSPCAVPALNLDDALHWVGCSSTLLVPPAVAPKLVLVPAVVAAATFEGSVDRVPAAADIKSVTVRAA